MSGIRDLPLKWLASYQKYKLQYVFIEYANSGKK